MSLASIIQSYLSDGEDPEGNCKDLRLSSETSNPGEDNQLILDQSPRSAEQVPQMELDLNNSLDGQEDDHMTQNPVKSKTTPCNMAGRDVPGEEVMTPAVGQLGGGRNPNFKDCLLDLELCEMAAEVEGSLTLEKDATTITPSFFFNDETLFDFGFNQPVKDVGVRKVPVKELVGVTTVHAKAGQKTSTTGVKSNGDDSIVVAAAPLSLTPMSNEVPAMRKRDDLWKICDSLSASLRKSGSKAKLNSGGQPVPNCKSVFSLREDLRRLSGSKLEHFSSVETSSCVGEKDGNELSSTASAKVIQNRDDNAKQEEAKSVKEAKGDEGDGQGSSVTEPEGDKLLKSDDEANRVRTTAPTPSTAPEDSSENFVNVEVTPAPPVRNDIQNGSDDLSPTPVISMLEEVEEPTQVKSPNEVIDPNHETVERTHLLAKAKAVLSNVQVQVQRPAGLHNSLYMRAFSRRRWKEQFSNRSYCPTWLPVGNSSAGGNKVIPALDVDDEEIDEVSSAGDEEASPEFEVSDSNEEATPSSLCGSAKDIELIDLDTTEDDDIDCDSDNLHVIDIDKQERSRTDSREEDRDTVTVIGVKIVEEEGHGEHEGKSAQEQVAINSQLQDAYLAHKMIMTTEGVNPDELAAKSNAVMVTPPCPSSSDNRKKVQNIARKRKRYSRLNLPRNGGHPYPRPANWMLNYILRRLIQKTKSSVRNGRSPKSRIISGDRKASDSRALSLGVPAAKPNTEDADSETRSEAVTREAQGSYKCPFCSHQSAESNGFIQHLSIHKGLISDPAETTPADNNTSANADQVPDPDHEEDLPAKTNELSASSSSSTESGSSGEEDQSIQPKGGEGPSGEKKHYRKQKRRPGLNKPFKCGQCQGTFENQMNLQKHVICHDRNRPWKFECTRCHLYFKTSFGYRRHNLFVHGNSSNPASATLSRNRRSPRLVNPVPIQIEPVSSISLDPCIIPLTRCDNLVNSADKVASGTANNGEDEESDDDDLFIPAYPCKFCRHMFTKKSLLAAHRASAHGTESCSSTEKTPAELLPVGEEEPPPPPLEDSRVKPSNTPAKKTNDQARVSKAIPVATPTPRMNFSIDYDADDDSTMVNGSVVGVLTRGRMSALLLNGPNPDPAIPNQDEIEVEDDDEAPPDLSAEEVEEAIIKKPDEEVASESTKIARGGKKGSKTETTTKCDICQKSFGSINAKIAHMTIHGEAKPFKCGQCDCSFKQLSNLQFHEKFHDPTRQFKCPKCSLYFDKQWSLRVHTGRMHKTEENLGGRNPATALNEECDRNSVVSSVVQKENDKKVVVKTSSSASSSSEEDGEEIDADVQEISLENAEPLSEKSEKASPDHPNQSSSSSEDNSEESSSPNSPEKECQPVESSEESVSNQSEIEDEAEVESVNTTCTCDVCGISLPNPEAKQDHMTVHMSGKLIKCGQCKRLFKQLAHLKLHEKFHDSTLPFTCSKCNLFYKTKRSLEVHVARMHHRRKSFGVKTQKQKPWAVRAIRSLEKSNEAATPKPSPAISGSSGSAANSKDEASSPTPGPSHRELLMSPGAKSNVTQLSTEVIATPVPASTTSDDEVDYEVEIAEIAGKKGAAKEAPDVEEVILRDSNYNDYDEHPTEDLPTQVIVSEQEANGDRANATDMPQKKRRRVADITKKFKCNLCSQSFWRLAHLKVHEEYHDSSRQFKCPFCNLYYKKEYARGIHVTVMHKGKKNRDGGQQEPQPVKSVSSEPNLVRSKGPVTIPRARVKVTPRFFKPRTTVKSPVAEENEVTAKVQTKPGQVGTDSNGAVQQMPLEPYPCRQSEAQLEEAQYPCTQCDRSFNHPATLRSHKRFHDPTRPWKCSRCVLYFDTKRSLVAHAGRVHKGKMRFQKETKSLEKVESTESSKFIPLLTSRRHAPTAGSSIGNPPPPTNDAVVSQRKNDPSQNPLLHDMWSQSLDSLVMPSNSIVGSPLSPITCMASSSSTIKERKKRIAGINARARTQSFIAELAEDVNGMEKDDDDDVNEEQSHSDEESNSSQSPPDLEIAKSTKSTKRKAVPKQGRKKIILESSSMTLPRPVPRNVPAKVAVPDKEKQYQCPTCMKTFGVKANLTVHMLTHTGQRPHLCSTCSKGFTTMGNLKQHILTHTGGRPHVCQVCSKGFSTVGNLKQHMTSQHNNP